MAIDIRDFEYTGDKKFDIKKSKTKIKDFYESEEEYNTMMAELHEKMDKHQSLMYAHDRYSMLLILQASDAAGRWCGRPADAVDIALCTRWPLVILRARSQNARHVPGSLQCQP